MLKMGLLRVPSADLGIEFFCSSGIGVQRFEHEAPRDWGLPWLLQKVR